MTSNTNTIKLMSTCSVCVCEIDDDEDYITCSAGHTIHSDECLIQYLGVIKSNIEKPISDFWEKNNKIKCPMGDCSIDEEQVYTKKSKTVKEWCETTRKVSNVVERYTAIVQNEEDAKREEENKKKDLENKMITDITEILSTCISCPHCSQVFFDFTGCLALTCASCKMGFCGLCLKKHEEGGKTSSDAHIYVKSHMDVFDEETKKEYGIHGSYFISTPGWTRWKEKIKMDRIMEYFKTIKKSYVRNSFSTISDYLQKTKSLEPEYCKRMHSALFTYNINSHMVRISTTFWLIYSARNNVKFEDVVKKDPLTDKNKKEIEDLVVKAIKKKHPAFVPIEEMVPGEKKEEINYPIKALPILIEVIEDWGMKNGHW
jgi:hypothetical protein